MPPSNTEEVVDEQGGDGAAPPEEGGDHASADDDTGGDEGDTEEDEESTPVVEVRRIRFTSPPTSVPATSVNMHRQHLRNVKVSYRQFSNSLKRACLHKDLHNARHRLVWSQCAMYELYLWPPWKGYDDPLLC